MSAQIARFASRRTALVLLAVVAWSSANELASAQGELEPGFAEAPSAAVALEGGSTGGAESVFFSEIPSVFAVSKYEQPLTDAPSNVTIVTEDEIRNFGYRTLGDLLASVPGFFVTYDRTFAYAGVRGFLRPGDYNSRILVLVDGHRLNDPLYDSSTIGHGLSVDLSWVERVEVVRSPGSSLYGTNAFFGVVNVITKRGRDLDGVEAGGTVGSLDTYGARVVGGVRQAPDLEVLVGGAYLDSAGRPTLYFPEYDDPATQDGVAVGVDDQRSYDLFGKVEYRDFELSVARGYRAKTIPTGSFGTVFGSDRNRIEDDLSWADLSYGSSLARGWELAAHAYYDHFHESGHYLFDYTGADPPELVLNVDDITGQRVGAVADVTCSAFEHHHAVAGTEVRYNFDLRLRNGDVEPPATYVDIDDSTVDFAAYVEDELTWTSWLSLQAGLRFDRQGSFGEHLSPRAAVITHPLPDTAVKLIYAEAFRAPNRSELAYATPEGGAGASLKPETIRTVELVGERRLLEQLRLTASVYHYWIDDLLEATDPLDDGPSAIRNVGSSRALGLELVLEGRATSQVTGRASYGLVGAEDADRGTRLTNSPQHLAKLGLGIELFDRRLVISPETRFVSSRRTLSGATVGAYWITNLSLRSERLLEGLGATVTLYDVFDDTYLDPVSADFAQDAIRQDGRTVWLELDYRFGWP